MCVPSAVGTTASRYSQQSPRADQLDHHAVQPGSPSSPSSPSVSIGSVSTFALLDTSQLDAFPSLIRPRANSTATPQSHQSHKSKSWASIAALSHSPSSPTTPKKVDVPRQPPALWTTEDHPSLPTAGPSFDSNVTAAHHYPCPSQSPHTWASIASSDLWAWTASWNTEGGGSTVSETTTAQGKKGKGKQKQRFASGSFSF